MKAPFLLFAFLALNAYSQTIASHAPSLPQYVITDAGPHSRVWSTVIWQTNDAGIAEATTNSVYTEIATGLN
jgi:hypothetical protein